MTVDWNLAKKSGIIDGDFYLADLLSENNKTLKDKLYVLLKTSYYELDRRKNESGLFSSSGAEFYDNQKAHIEFWNIYERPPREEYWDYTIERRDLLVPQDVRERNGSFFTPQILVEKSQEYLTDVLGENWQDDYYIWDCAAGTGNLLTGLTNKYNIWASTLDEQDVDVMRDRVKHGANLLEEHIFQFDFLNDSFDKLPSPLKEIIDNEEKRNKLVVYINPPYAETAVNRTSEKERLNKRGVSFTRIQEKYSKNIGIATKELFAQFLIRVNAEIPNCILAQFSTLKIIQGPNFVEFRNFFNVKFIKGFVVPANTFDNVGGSFPIGFMIWEYSNNKIERINCEVFTENGTSVGNKNFYAYNENIFITDWYRKYHTRALSKNNIVAIGLYGSDFQHSNFIRITNCDVHPNRWTFITHYNLITTSIYLTVRHCTEATWLNDRDQFLYPNDKWQEDTEFQNDCLTFALFHGQNRITSKYGTNHWIPFTEKEVDAKEKFESNFMVNFITGKITQEKDLENYQNKERTTPLEFSEEAIAVFEVGRELWKYYHEQAYKVIPPTKMPHNTDASLYDIREYFQGIDENGKMNKKSDDEKYNEVINLLRLQLKKLAKKISYKVYEYGFLMKD